MHSINGEVESFHMVDTKSKTKTKAEMLHELESIKGLLHEEDDIPILQEMIAGEKVKTVEAQTLKPSATPKVATPTVATPKTEQQDFFDRSSPADSASQLLNTLNDLAALADTVTAHKTSAGQSTSNKSASQQSTSQQSIANNSAAEKTAARTESIKASGENPFLPQHIRTRLHGNNPPPFFELETAKKISGASRPTTQLGNTQNTFTTTKPVSHQQEMIDDIIEAMLPQITKALRERLSGMSKEMLEILIEEK